MTMAKDTRTFIQRVEDYKRAQQSQPAAATVTLIRRNTADTSAYVAAARTAELEFLAHAPNGTRNDVLNTCALKLAGLPIDRDELRRDLIDACIVNRHYQDDGPKMVNDTIDSAFTKADLDGPRVIPEQPTRPVLITEVDAAAITGITPGPLAHVFDAEGDFWKSRDSLNAIYNAALTRMCSPWAVLGHCTARALTLVRPGVKLPPLIGGPGSLNWFAAIAAPSGGGKGSASAVSRELIPHDIRERGLGSGEGITGAFYKPGTKDTPPEVHEAVMFVADEIDTVTALGSRTGSTMMGILRSGFAGETLGFSYITKGRDIHIDAHTYRMTVIISVQPARAGALMGDHGGGTPQRFMWFPGIDPRITDTPANIEPYPLHIPPPGEWQYPRTLTVPAEARELILRERAKAARGEQAAMDGHAIFCREKLAFALAVLDGRTQMTSEDWRLSGIAAEVSARTRDWVSAGLATAIDQEATEKGRLMGVSYAASDEEKAYRADQRTARLARWALDKLADGPLTNRELHRSVASRDRPWLDGAIQGLTNAGIVGMDDEKRWTKL